ncbi:hypothetical protein [Streptomyces sp. 7N604]|uniref:hypothetical protein n=1 Tax=Streptomyces sp. 7N604 TaxID=3457415 RepID=UPI003FD31658
MTDFVRPADHAARHVPDQQARGLAADARSRARDWPRAAGVLDRFAELAER